MNLDGLYTHTTVSFQTSPPFDELSISGQELLVQVGIVVHIFRISFAAWQANIHERAEVLNKNNFPLSPFRLRGCEAFAKAFQVWVECHPDGEQQD